MMLWQTLKIPSNYLLSLLILLAIGGCASYQPLPLNDQANFLKHIPALTIDAHQLNLPELPLHSFAAGPEGLDMTDVAILAVVNNPDLKLARNDAHIAHAQAFSASLLPNPQLAMMADFVRDPVGGSTPAFSIGPSYDFGALLTHSTLSKAARADADKTDLSLLWQEWQVIAQARMVFIKLTQGEKLTRILQQQRDEFAQRSQRNQVALQRGLITAETATVALTSLQDVQRQINEGQRQQNQARHDLNALLGLAPDVPVPLKGSAQLPPLARDQIDAILPHLAQRRPDLRALEFGYAAQDQRYRAAIIAQFPSLVIGLTRARDTSNVSTQGFNISLSLPVFNHNQGSIAIEQSTRQKLHDEYQQRINVAHSDIDRILTEQAINQQQMLQINSSLQQLTTQRQKVQAALTARNVDALVLSNIDTAWLAKQTEQVTLEQAMLEQRVALQTLIGGELPTQLSQKAKESHQP
ncbi:TolC family protein [Glaciimonas immobilis]|uniref:Outer membrane protein TolC n=1 Tax=Glaciimonas immobilis TaxID=728004 RepID=A0A840RV45_9BURK|nr:TolC family protein [Glaciimonas immobilis]KAF3997729.1 TolC family protein [Glaciimonas immobilis]MBB5200544.1 outer membrane protein TolC [Glaciimonas immobilis]